MFKGKTSAALDLLACKGNSGVLHVNDLANRDDPTSLLVLDALKSNSLLLCLHRLMCFCQTI